MIVTSHVTKLHARVICRSGRMLFGWDKENKTTGFFYLNGFNARKKSFNHKRDVYSSLMDSAQHIINRGKKERSWSFDKSFNMATISISSGVKRS